MVRNSFRSKFKQQSLSNRWIGFGKHQQYKLWLEQLEERSVPATITWDGGPGGTGNVWTTAANWVGDVLPNANDDAVIPVAFSGVTINVTGGVAKTLDTFAALTQSGSTFTIGSAASDVSVLRNGFSLSSGTFTAGGTINISGSSTWTGGTLGGKGVFNHTSGRTKT